MKSEEVEELKVLGNFYKKLHLQLEKELRELTMMVMNKVEEEEEDGKVAYMGEKEEEESEEQ